MQLGTQYQYQYRVPVGAKQKKREPGKMIPDDNIINFIIFTRELSLIICGKFTFDRVTEPLVNLITEFTIIVSFDKF